MLPRHIYVHVPFCARRCTYCDFSIAVRARVPVDQYLDGLAAELGLRFGPPPPAAGRPPVDTVYFGGGTPSRLGGEGIARALDLLRRWMEPTEGAEITVEANPDDVDPGAVAAWRAAGVTRLSLGGQTFSAPALAWMRRTHSVAQTERAIDCARTGGVDDLSLDLIFALPAAVERDWAADVSRALALAPTHLSLYGLTVEPGTPLGRWHARGEVAEADEDRYADEFLHAHHALAGAGFTHYEVSNFARPGHHARHNSSYWLGVPYLGLGPAAHGFDGERRRWNHAPYAAWLHALTNGHDPAAGSELRDSAARIAEEVYLGLRTQGGLRLEGEEPARAARWVEAGWATLDDGRLRLTPPGWLRLDALAADLTAFRSRS